MCAGNAWIAAGTSFSTSKRIFSALVSPSQTSPSSHRRWSADWTESPKASGVSQSMCHLDLPAGQTSSQLAGNFQAAVRAGERSTITARSPPGEKLLEQEFHRSAGQLGIAAASDQLPQGLFAAGHDGMGIDRQQRMRPRTALRPTGHEVRPEIDASRPSATAGPRRCLLPIRGRPRNAQRSRPDPSRPTSSGGLAPAPG